MKKKQKKVGIIDEVVITALNLSIETNSPIFLADTNIDHMKDRHPEDYEKYGDRIEEIISKPDYIAKHPKNDSIQYIKVYYDVETEERVLVALRSTARGVMYARSLFVMSDSKIKSYKEKGTLIPYKKET